MTKHIDHKAKQLQNTLLETASKISSSTSMLIHLLLNTRVKNTRVPSVLIKHGML